MLKGVGDRCNTLPMFSGEDRVEQWSANCGPLSNFEWAAGYLLLFQLYKVVVGRVIAAAYIQAHCSLKVGVGKSSSFGLLLLLHHSSNVKSGIICLSTFNAIIFIYGTVVSRGVALETEQG